MTERSVEPPAPPTRGNPIERVQRWVQVQERTLRRVPLVVAIQRILDTYNAAGGGITSSGLSYGALFAVIPGLLLTLSLLVIVVDNEDVRQQAIDWIITQVPPLKTFAEQIVGSIADQARYGTVLGLVLFIWGASGFYLALEGAMERLFPGPRRRDPIIGRIRGAIAVVLVVGTVIAMFLLSYTLATVDILKALGAELTPVLPAVTPMLAVAVSSFVCLIVYVLVPSDTPGWRAAWAPALAAGIGIGLLTSLFSLVSGLLVGGFTALGALASVFVALVWFNWVFQMLLYGGAWARLRRDRRHLRGVPR
jgi:YihY family inner membrane protein